MESCEVESFVSWFISLSFWYSSMLLYESVLHFLFICWERQSHICGVTTPAQPLKNGCWAWKTFLCGNKEPTHTTCARPSILPDTHVEIACRITLNECPFALCKNICQWPLGMAPAFSISDSMWSAHKPFSLHELPGAPTSYEASMHY